MALVNRTSQVGMAGGDDRAMTRTVWEV